MSNQGETPILCRMACITDKPRPNRVRALRVFFLVFSHTPPILCGKVRNLRPEPLSGLGLERFSMHECWLSNGGIAAHLSVNSDTIYKCITAKEMPAYKPGRLWQFFVSEVDRWTRAGQAAKEIASLKPAPDEESRSARH